MKKTDSDGLRLTDRKRANIIDAAVSLFNELGFDNASMDGIAVEAEVSKRTVYNHFESKEALFGEIVARLKEKGNAAIQLDYRRDLPLLNQLCDFCRKVVDFHCSNDSRMLVRVVVSKFLKTPELANAMFGNAKMFEGILHRWVRQAQADGLLRKCDVPFASKQLLALLETFVVWPQLLKNASVPSPTNRANIAQSAAEMFLDHYSTKPISGKPISGRPIRGKPDR